MPPKHIAELKRFQSQLVIYGEWDTAPGNSGVAGLAVVQKRKGFEIWTWDDVNGLEQYGFVDGESPRGVVERLLDDETLASSVDPKTVEIAHAQDKWAELIAMAWQDSEDTRRQARLLLCLADTHLKALLETHSPSSAEVGAMLEQVLEFAESLGADDLPGNVGARLVAPLDLAQARDELLRAVAAAAEVARSAERQSDTEAEQARPLLEQADRICGRWEVRHPPSRGGGITVKALGYYSLHRYVVGWLARHGTAPSGTHRIPGGTETFRRQAKDFDVDFDELN